MSRHRSPGRGRRPDPDLTVPIRIVMPPASHRLPPPPSGAAGARAAVAAVAAGAVIAAGETIVDTGGPGVDPDPLVISAMAVVADPPVDPVFTGVGGDQPLPASVAALDAGSDLDVGNLVKAVEIGRELARREALLTAALSFGAPAANLVGESAYVRPVLGRVTSSSGPRWGRTHEGLDVANSIGTPIFAVTGGVVEESGPASGFGLWVVIRHDDGTRSVYGHINRTFVEVGERVSAGEQIAEVGNRGFSTGPHLHLEIEDTEGGKIDPEAWLQDRGVAYPG